MELIAAVALLALIVIVTLGRAGRALQRAWVLSFRQVRCDEVHLHLGRAVALRGRVRLIEPLARERLGGELLYHRTLVVQAGHRTSRTVHSQVETATFGIADGGERVVVVADEPTCVEGLERRSQRDPARLMGLVRERSVDEWLPVPDELTVVGRPREEGAIVLGRDPALGLLLAPAPAARVALLQALSGLLPLLLLLGLAGLALFVRSLRPPL